MEHKDQTDSGTLIARHRRVLSMAHRLLNERGQSAPFSQMGSAPGRALSPEQQHLILKTSQQHRKLIESIIARYRYLDPALEVDDLRQEAFLAVARALRGWNPQRALEMKFSTFLYWHVSKKFQALFPGHDKQVLIYTVDDRRYVTTVSYPDFIKHRKRWNDDQYVTRIESRLRPLPEMTPQEE
jgi:DNA-directed RNA polymerase specialized sigma24 family protein